MGNKIWLSMHTRNFGCHKIICLYIRPFMLADVKSDTHKVEVQGIIYNLCLA